MKTIIIPDIHNRVDWIESFLSSLEYDRVVFLGDYFDEFNDTLKDAEKSAEWLKQSLCKSNRIHIMGTHDMYYRFPLNHHLIASGNSCAKESVINNILNKEDWNKIVLFHCEQNFLISHAGLHPFIIGYNNFRKVIKENTAFCDAKDNEMNCWTGAGKARGGLQTFGGITWLDWDKEFEPIPFLNQIVGHTEHKIPQEKHIKYSKNYCIDTRNKHIGILENGEFLWKNMK